MNQMNSCNDFIMYCILLYYTVPSVLTIEAEAGMTVYGQC